VFVVVGRAASGEMGSPAVQVLAAVVLVLSGLWFKDVVYAAAVEVVATIALFTLDATLLAGIVVLFGFVGCAALTTAAAHRHD
jgi:hypothetical protein